MQKPIVGTGFTSGTDTICSDCLALLNAGKPSKEVLTANLPSRIAFAPFNIPTQDAPPTHATTYTLKITRLHTTQPTPFSVILLLRVYTPTGFQADCWKLKDDSGS